MKIVRLIRHGKSAANAGAATQDHTSIPLTDRGVEQAHQVTLSFVEPTELIVASPLLSRPSDSSSDSRGVSARTFRDMADTRIHVPRASKVREHYCGPAPKLGGRILG
jgi:hypothetical protein